MLPLKPILHSNLHNLHKISRSINLLLTNLQATNFNYYIHSKTFQDLRAYYTTYNNSTMKSRFRYIHILFLFYFTLFFFFSSLQFIQEGLH